MPFDLDLTQVQPLLASVSQVFSPIVATDILLAAGQKVGAEGEKLVSDYPEASRKPLPVYYDRVDKKGRAFKSKFKSLAQQHKVFALAKQGRIPYKRTGKLGQSITSDARAESPGLVVVRIGSNLSYAPFVLDQLLQSHYHMGTWAPIQLDIERGLPQLAETAVTAVVAEVEKRIHG